MRRNRLSVTLLVLSASILASGCSSGSEESEESEEGYSVSIAGQDVLTRMTSPAGGLEPVLEPAAFTEGDTVHLLLFGSSSCPPTPEDVTSLPGGILQVTLEESQPDVACTADYGPHGYTLTGEVVEGTTIVSVINPPATTGQSYPVRPLP